jgi:hypothetical protein
MKIILKMTSVETKIFLNVFLESRLERNIKLSIQPDRENWDRVSQIVTLETDEKISPVKFAEKLLLDSFKKGPFRYWGMIGYQKE